MSLNRREFMGALSLGGGASLLATRLAAEELPVSARELWDFVRNQAVIEPGEVWLNTAEGGPSLRRVLIEEFRQREALALDRDAYLRSRCSGQGVLDLVGAVAAFISAQPQDITFTSGASAALGLVAAGLDLVADDEILTTTHEHDAGIYPWLLAAKRRGVRVVQVSLPAPLPHPQHVIDAFT